MNELVKKTIFDRGIPLHEENGNNVKSFVNLLGKNKDYLVQEKHIAKPYIYRPRKFRW